MSQDEHTTDLFAIPEFWKSSHWFDEPDLGVIPKPSSTEALSHDTPFTSSHAELSLSREGFFKTPPILDLTPRNEALREQPRLPETLRESLTSEDAPWSWDSLLELKPLIKRPEFRTWQTFDNPESSQPELQFLSEAGTAAFDAFLLAPDSSHDQYENIHPNVYSACLLSLALGRESVLFSWAPQKASFVQCIDLLKVPGYSGETLQGLKEICQESGNANRFLRLFVEKTYSVSTTPARVALANAIDKLLLVIQTELGVRGPAVHSLLHLQAVIDPVHTVVTHFRSLVLKLSRSPTDERLLSVLVEEAQSAEFKQLSLCQTTLEVLRLVSKPWTDFVEEWIGLASEKGVQLTKDGPGKSFVKVESHYWVDDQGFELEEPDFFLDAEKMPSFIPDDVSVSIFETGRNLRFLRSYHPEHILAYPNRLTAQSPPKLEWHFDWDSITQVEHKAAVYEADLRRELEKTAAVKRRDEEGGSQLPEKGAGYELQMFGQDESLIEQRVLASMAKLSEPLDRNGQWDDLADTLQRQLFGSRSSDPTDNSGFSPHWSLLPRLSFGPIIAAQARLVNREALKLLFKAHGLREHINLQKQFQLLGNGMFCSRLSHALFDPDLDTAERQTGVALSGGAMGLRLNGRSKWPPASSEMRLALMGVLSESYEPKDDVHSQETDNIRHHKDQDDLPGEMSFAVRDLSPEEIERCIDPDSIEALDFLRLSYKPPSELLSIMTPMVLVKYDRIFKLLLRILRMLYVVNQLSRDVGARGSRWCNPDEASMRFEIEAHHFISTVTAYFFDTGISIAWHRFESLVDKIWAELESENEDSARTNNYSPDKLRESQEHTLDEIMSVLLLRKRQQPVLKLLEDIFRVILQFAKGARTMAGDVAGGSSENGDKEDEYDAADMRSLYASFRKRVEVFIVVCRGLSEKSSQSSRKEFSADDLDSRLHHRGERSEEHTISQLLLKLDITGYYTDRARA